MCVAQNFGVSKASSNAVILVNDDHVFRMHWDTIALNTYDPMTIVSFLVVSPEKQWYKYMVSEDFGRTPDDFDNDAFQKFSCDVVFDKADKWFACFPIMMNRFRYLALGGFDMNCLNGVFANNDLFIKAKIMGMEFKTQFDLLFYHFGSIASKTDGWDNRIRNHKLAQSYVYEKWGHQLHNDNSHFMFSADDNIEFKEFNK